MADKHIKHFCIPQDWGHDPRNICIGNLISDPFRPHEFISQDKPNEDTDINSIKQHGWNHTLDETNDKVSDTDGQVSQFFKLAARRRENAATKRKMSTKTLTTITLKQEPTLEYITKRCKEKAVLDNALPWKFGFDPLYMITAVKIASGLEFIETFSWSDSPERGVCEVVTNFTPTIETDVVFAYQLLKIEPGGGRFQRIPMYDISHIDWSSMVGDEIQDTLDWIFDEEMRELIDPKVEAVKGQESLDRDVDCFSIREDEGTSACDGESSAMSEDEDYVIC